MWSAARQSQVTFPRGIDLEQPVVLEQHAGDRGPRSAGVREQQGLAAGHPA